MTEKSNETKKISIIDKTQLKTCFVIMPIADIASYDSGHFHRVYQHLIKPACELAGFHPIRADDVNSSNMIVVDILKKIIECDLAICDLSARNPNVLYELGLRQAFNKKTVLIKDSITESIFDVQGFRYAQYDNTLRIDNVKNEISKLANALNETYESKTDINSIVQLLQIEPAKIDNKTELSDSDTIIFQAINELTKKVENINQRQNNYYAGYISPYFDKNTIPTNFAELKNLVTFYDDAREVDFPQSYFGDLYYKGSLPFGKFIEHDPKLEKDVFVSPSGEILYLSKNSDEAKTISRFSIKNNLGS
ncbi:hypothetical protein Rahaq_2552 [Rahnella aceris]|uniref:Nucleoside 2-deoxyribosyltransferase n=1 Tax=Rahnella sp. (strain Y9602) TaxID=2703885 RepID=A0A0H3FBB9_RAHSY|nr:hypothetical protein [Rahnella aceris]ADW74159.1 hypothetical protein Rahaq_2552 [Rahnella aceris]MBU9839371.1 hypothetical protein [Rahnella aceris]